MNATDTARAFDMAMKERARDAHAFEPMKVPGMEIVCDKCYTHRDRANHTA